MRRGHRLHLSYLLLPSKHSYQTVRAAGSTWKGYVRALPGSCSACGRSSRGRARKSAGRAEDAARDRTLFAPSFPNGLLEGGVVLEPALLAV